MHRLLARRVRSLMLTSGTLAPLESFAAELQLGFRHTLENPHIIEPHQVGGLGWGLNTTRIRIMEQTSHAARSPHPQLWAWRPLPFPPSGPPRNPSAPALAANPPHPPPAPPTPQVWVGVVPSGPTGAPLNSSYQSRSSPRYRDDLGNALVNFARVVPDGLLVFFPAYSVMTACLEHWRSAPGEPLLGVWRGEMGGEGGEAGGGPTACWCSSRLFRP
jgi:hypothetical protein